MAQKNPLTAAATGPCSMGFGVASPRLRAGLAVAGFDMGPAGRERFSETGGLVAACIDDAVGAGAGGSTILASGRRLVAAAREAITLAGRQGRRPGKVHEAIASAAGGSWTLGKRAPHLSSGARAPESAVGVFVKDPGVVRAMARAAQHHAPVSGALSSAALRGVG